MHRIIPGEGACWGLHSGENLRERERGREVESGEGSGCTSKAVDGLQHPHAPLMDLLLVGMADPEAVAGEDVAPRPQDGERRLRKRCKVRSVHTAVGCLHGVRRAERNFRDPSIARASERGW